MVAAAACSGATEPADRVFVDARVWTANPQQPWAEAVAVRGDRIVAVGDREAVAALIGSDTAVHRGGGGLLVPGFIDAHVHFLQGGFRLSSVQLRDATTQDEFIRRIGDFAASVAPGTWITGGDWDHENWGGELPRRDWIDAVTPNHPVFVSRLDGHMALANSAALEAAGVSGDTADVDGGEIVRGGEGHPTGIFKDNAMGLVARASPPPPDELADRALEAAMTHVAAEGVTSVHHMGTWDDLAVFERARADGRLRTRIYASVPLDTWERLRDRISDDGVGDAWLRIGGLKGFVDGSLGSHTAAFLEPFTDAPDDRGLLVNSPDDLYEWIAGADAAGLNVNVHAIGDRAIRLQLDIFERVASENGGRDRRFRIEHAQHIAPEDISRFAEIGVIASMQPYHAIDDGRWAERLIGPTRAETTYAFRALLDAGATLAFGSDWFVAPPTPREGIYAAVTRRTLDGDHPEGWIPAQKIDVEAALRAYTIDAAFAAFAEADVGSIEVGKLADLVLLDRDVTSIGAADLREARALVTTVGGRVVHTASTGEER